LSDRCSRCAGGGSGDRLRLDTNVVLSALVFGSGPAARLRQAWQGGQLLPLMSTVTVQELIRVLAYPKFKLDASDQEEMLADYLPWAKAVTVPNPAPRVPPCRDPFDVPFLHLALAGKARFLITGDADLLALAAPATRPRLPFQLITVQAFLDQHAPRAA
jgi:uncharacterized protein